MHSCTMDSKEQDRLSVRYVKLHFAIEFIEDTVLPVYKVSAIRGGMGEMLLRSHCIRNRNCEQCDFRNECVVQRMMYSKMEIQPEFMTSGDSVGYVLECEDYREEFSAGDRLSFQLLLFGKTIVYFSLFLDAFFRLGLWGIGKYGSKFSIVSIQNTRKEDILRGNDINLSRYSVQTIEEYVKYRLIQLEREKKEGNELLRFRFRSPLTLKYQGAFLREFDLGAISKAVLRRIYILDCFEGIDLPLLSGEGLEIPAIKEERHRNAKIPRYSSRQDSKMVLRGIEGEMITECPGQELLSFLIAGELIHIGKNTSFGFGRYRLSMQKETDF
ncbi:MAG: CRISPR system precrRNA processing endoribonuclease RAMP protein Cas6 [Lachnospiraceae bacterium]|nr:CRISPR system precrRNA processing endoribonuclease RAMP protein Cas6 [Lachnospiraceae bacterium]